MPYSSWIEIYKKNLLDNFSVFKKLAKDAEVACVVKANAYGHGLEVVVGVLKDRVAWFCVDNLDEALVVKKISPKVKILVMGVIFEEAIKKAILKGISFVVYDKQILKKIASLKLKKKARVHLKIETGLNRQGVSKKEVLVMADYLKRNQKFFFPEGISTHFADIEDTLDPTFAKLQLARFNETVALLEKEGLNFPLKHCAATAASFLYKDTHFNLLRLGIGLYGLWPSKETRVALSYLNKKRDDSLRPVLAWRAKIAQVKEVKKGESVGYGRTWFAQRKCRIAIVPVGYADGYSRGLSNNADVLVKGRHTSLVGRVAMNMIMIDVSQIEGVKKGDVVTLIGRDKKSNIKAEDLAERLNTINYEVVARVNVKLPRILI